jgi:hypothetical protein
MRTILGKSLTIRYLGDLLMTNDEMREIQAQQDELTRKLNEKISGDLSKFQKQWMIYLSKNKYVNVNISFRKSKKNRNRQTRI